MSNDWNKLVEIVSTLLEISPESVTVDLGTEKLEAWDSLNHLSICTAAGQEFGTDLSAAEMLSVRNVGDLARLLQDKGVYNPQ